MSNSSPNTRTAFLVVLSLHLLFGASLGAQADSARTPPLFSKWDALLASGFVAGTFALAPLDRLVAKTLQDSAAQSDRFVRLVSLDVSAVGRPGLLIASSAAFLIGKAVRQPRVAHIGLHATEAIITGELANVLLKGTAGRARPREDIERPFDFRLGRGFHDGRYRSFASSHTVSSFAVAAVVTSEVAHRWPKTRWCLHRRACLSPAWYVAPVVFGGAGVIGLSRMYNNEHWASDVMMGAAIGTFAGLKVVRYNHTRPRNRIDRLLLGSAIWVSPSGTPIAGLSMPTPF